MKRNKGIIAYGTDEDREKLTVLAQLSNKSNSEWIIVEIQKRYREAFGETAPKRIISQH